MSLVKGKPATVRGRVNDNQLLGVTPLNVPPFGFDDNDYPLLHKVATGVPNPPVGAGPHRPVLMRLHPNRPDGSPR